jgi:hypothetical protein
MLEELVPGGFEQEPAGHGSAGRLFCRAWRMALTGFFAARDEPKGESK